MGNRIKNWYYWEDGTGPFHRVKKAHKIFLGVFIAVALFSFCVLEFDSLPMKLFSTASLFGFVVLMGFAGNLFGDNATLILMQGGNAVFLLVLSLFGGACLGWIITPLYLIFAIADIHYCIKAKKSNPQIAAKDKPVHKNLTKSDNPK